MSNTIVQFLVVIQTAMSEVILTCSGVLPALGHDKVAREDEVLGALRLTHKPMHITHIFNVSTFHHR